MITAYTSEGKEAIATEVSEALRQEIGRGAVPFERFMEVALYHPHGGYYAQGEVRTGRGGDFFTSVSVGPLFGAVLARQFGQMWRVAGSPAEFWLIEQGAMDGQLMADIFAAVQRNDRDFAKAARGLIVEPMEGNQEKQKEKLRGLEMEWAKSLNETKLREGIFYSNELVDSFPVRWIVFREGSWREKFVMIESDSFKLVEKEIADAKLKKAIGKRTIPPIEGYETEINLRMEEWIGQVARVIKKGFVVTIDYGFDQERYYNPWRKQGTLQAYSGHKKSADVLANPGEQDITSHVDFTALVEAGEKEGLKTMGLVDQNRFCVGIVMDEFAEGRKLEEIFGGENLQRAWETLTNPGIMGSKFHALVQGKDVDGAIDGLKFSRERKKK